MKTKQKKRISHIPRSIANQPLEVIRLNGQITAVDQLKLSNGMRMAWQRMKDGTGGADDWQLLADCSNLCSIKAQSTGADMAHACDDAAIALKVIQERASASGKWATCYLSREPLDQLMDIHDQLLSLLSYKECMDLAKEAGVRARAAK